MDATLSFHPAANIFPLEDESLDALAADIKEQGQQCPIELCDDKIIDGRRRWMACRIAQVDPEFVTVHPTDPVAYVLSLNLHRRHLTPSQKSMVAARSREYYDTEAAKRMKAGKKSDPVENLPHGKARDAAGAVVGVSGRSVDHATTVLKKGSKELQRAVEAGRVAVSRAASVANSVPKREQIKAALAPNPVTVTVRSLDDECEAARNTTVVGHLYTCPTCGQNWPEGKEI